MSDKFLTGNENLEFRQIVLNHIKKILEISTHELRDTTQQIINNNNTAILKQEDTRYNYIQAIENLAFVLMPYFDERMKKLYYKCEFVISAYDFELTRIFRNEIIHICREKGIIEIPKSYFADKKVQYAKNLFCELNALMKRNDYLKEGVYGEDSSEVIEDNEESGE